MKMATVRDAGLIAAFGGTAIALWAVVLAVGPWLLFWSVGVLTGFVVPFTAKTWLAAVVFLACVRGGGSSS